MMMLDIGLLFRPPCTYL